MCASHELPPKVGDSTNADTTSRPVVAYVCFETRPLAGNRSREAGAVPADRTVRLDEDQQDVSAADARQAGVHRRALAEDGAAAPGHLGDEQPCLPDDGVGDRRRKGRRQDALLVVEPAQVVHAAHAEQHDHDDSQRPEHTPFRPAAHGGVQRAERPSDQRVEHEREHDGRRDDEEHQPPRRDARQHGADRRHVAHVPEQVDGAAVERRRGHVRVPDDDQHGPHRAEPCERAPRERSEPRIGHRHRQHAHGQLHRQFAVPADRGCRPEVLEREGRVEHHERRRQRREPRATTLVLLPSLVRQSRLRFLR